MKNRILYSVSIAALAMMLSGSSYAASEDASNDLSPFAPPAAPQSLTPPTGPAEPAKPPVMELAVPAEDAAVTEKLRDLIEGKLAQHITREHDRAGVKAFYSSRGFAPLWVGHNAALPRANAAATFLRGVDADGLDPADYPVPTFADQSPDRLAADELELTNSVLTFVRHAATGRTAFSRVSGAVYFDLNFPNPEDVLGKLTATGDVGAALDAFNPQHKAYKALKAQLAVARQSQGAHNHTDTIIANMERWRWMPHDLGPAYVAVNVPDYTLKVVDHDRTAWTTRIVVGKPGTHATPLLTETMKYITVN
ncbi:MAG: hypothetical protein ACREDY_15880, partial [Bradyrhizobium sp.]